MREWFKDRWVRYILLGLVAICLFECSQIYDIYTARQMFEENLHQFDMKPRGFFDSK